MSIQLSEKEAKFIIESRSNPKLLLWASYVILAILLFAYFAARDGTINWDTFGALVFVIAVSSVLNLQFRIYPSLENLYSLIERKIAESNEAIQSIHAARSGK